MPTVGNVRVTSGTGALNYVNNDLKVAPVASTAISPATVMGPTGPTGPIGSTGPTGPVGTINPPLAIGDGNVLGANPTNLVVGNSNTVAGSSGLLIGDFIDDNGNIGGLYRGAVGTAGFAAAGSKQREEYVFYAAAFETPVQLTTDGQNPSPVNTAHLPDNCAAMFAIDMIAMNQNTQDVISWRLTRGVISRGTGPASVAMSSQNPVFALGPVSTNAPSVNLPTVLADTANGGFAIMWNPPGGDDWNVVASLILLKTVVG